MAYTPPKSPLTKPDCGPLQVAEWARVPSGRAWIVRDMTPEEIATAYPPPAPPVLTEAQAIAAAWEALRGERNRRLAFCDWTQVADAPVDAAAWATYRQALRDMPGNTVDPHSPIWPTPPAN